MRLPSLFMAKMQRVRRRKLPSTLRRNAKDMSNVPAIEITPEDMTAKIIDVLTAAKVFSSKREARQLIAQGGLTVADTVLQDAEACLSADMFDADKSLLIRKGKKKYFRLLVK